MAVSLPIGPKAKQALIGVSLSRSTVSYFAIAFTDPAAVTKMRSDQ